MDSAAAVEFPSRSKNAPNDSGAVEASSARLLGGGAAHFGLSVEFDGRGVLLVGARGA